MKNIKKFVIAIETANPRKQRLFIFVIFGEVKWIIDEITMFIKFTKKQLKQS